MSVLYEVLTPELLKNLTPEQKKSVIIELIMFGKFDKFMKFLEILETDITEVISSREIVESIPMNIDSEMLVYLLERYEFEQGQNFFYNYAVNSTNEEIKEIVYDYFVDHYSDVILDNMVLYGSLIEE